MRVILKKFYETQKKETLMEYGRQLNQKGWLHCMMEGGYLSPDESTLFIYNRAPYYGQLLQYAADKESEYLAMVDQMVSADKFIKV